MAASNGTVALAEPNGRSSAPAAIGVSGVRQYGGVIFGDEYDRAWTGIEHDRTISRMLNDPVIGAALYGAEMLIRRVDWRVDPADDSEAALEVAEFVQECLDDMRGYWPGDTLARILTYLGWGWAVLSIGYKLRRGRAVDPPSKHDDGRVGWDEWLLIPQATRYGWEFDARNRATALIQQDPQTFKTIPIPLNRTMHLRYGARDNSPEGSTPLRVAFDAWYRGNRIKVVEGIGIERDLAGLPLMRIPSSDIEGNTATNTAAQNIVTSVRNDSQAGLVLASNRDANGEYFQVFELVSTGGQRAIDTDPVIRRYANETLMVFLANVMKTGQDQVGSYALSQTQGGLFQQGLGAHLDTVQNAINEQAVPSLIKFNGIDPKLTPTIAHGDVESADLERLGAYLKALADSGMLHDSAELRAFVHEVAGLPVPPVEDIEKEMAEEEKAAEEAAKAMQQAAGQQPAKDGQKPADKEAQPAKPKQAEAKTATEVPEAVRQFVGEDGSLTLSDLTQVVAWFDSVVGEDQRGMLNARLVGGD